MAGPSLNDRELRLELEEKIERARLEARENTRHLEPKFQTIEARFDALERSGARMSGRDAVVGALLSIVVAAIVSLLLRQGVKNTPVPTPTATVTVQARPVSGGPVITPAPVYVSFRGSQSPTQPSATPTPSPTPTLLPVPSPSPSATPVICLYLMGGPICI